VFSKADVWRLAARLPSTRGVASKRTAIVHLFGGGFFVGDKGAGYINDARRSAREVTRTFRNYRLQQAHWPAQLTT
jgi:hypothetical protein